MRPTFADTVRPVTPTGVMPACIGAQRDVEARG
jgi:hypothetical protein